MTTHQPTATADFLAYGPIGAELNRTMERRHADRTPRPSGTDRWTRTRLRVATALIALGSRLAGTPVAGIPAIGPRVDPITPS